MFMSFFDQIHQENKTQGKPKNPSMLNQIFSSPQNIEGNSHLIETLMKIEQKKHEMKKSFFHTLYSSPFVRGFYKNEPPVVDIELTGSKNEKKRLTALINSIAKNSETGRSLLQNAAEHGTKIGFDYQDTGYGYFDPTKNIVMINPCCSDAKLKTTLAHEVRHVYQHSRGLPDMLCQKDLATEVKLNRAAEADAQATAAQVALEIRATTRDSKVWQKFCSSYPLIANAISAPSKDAPVEKVIENQSKTMQDAFKGWFEQKNTVDIYEEDYLYFNLTSIAFQKKDDQLKTFEELPFEGNMSSKEIVEMFCQTSNGQCYFKDNPNILDDPKMCGISTETKNAADLFFQSRKNLTGKQEDKSYVDLPSRGSMYGRRAASENASDQNRSLKDTSDRKVHPALLTLLKNNKNR